MCPLWLTWERALGNLSLVSSTPPSHMLFPLMILLCIPFPEYDYPESFESSYQGINLWVLLGKPETGGWPFTSWASSLPCTLTSVTVASFCSRWVRPLPLIDGSACLECSSLSPPGSRPQVTSSGPPSLIAYVLFLGT